MKDIIDSLIKQNEPRVKCRNPVRPVYRDAVRNPVNFFTHFRSRKKKTVERLTFKTWPDAVTKKTRDKFNLKRFPEKSQLFGKSLLNSLQTKQKPLSPWQQTWLVIATNFPPIEQT